MNVDRPAASLLAAVAAIFMAMGSVGAQDGPGSMASEPFFADDFESGDRSHSVNGARWTGGSPGFNCVSIEVTDEEAFSGRYSLEFRYAGTGTKQQNGMCQQNFDLGTEFPHLWYEWRLRIPENYENRVFEGMASNDKLFLASDDPRYESASGYHVKVVGEVWPTDRAAPGRPSVSGRFRPLWGTNGTIGGVGMSHRGLRLVDFLSPEDRGRWVRIRLEISVATGPGANDGIWRIWKDDRLVGDFGDVPNEPVDGEPHGFRYHYFMGAHNAGYTDETTFRIDDLRIFTTDPGWHR